MKDGGIYPTFFCHVPGIDGCGVIPCLWSNPFQKQFVVDQVKAKFKELQIERFGFYGESWITNRPGLAPVEPAHRKECIFVYAEDRNGQCKTGWWPLREVRGQVVLDDFVAPTDAPTSIGMSFSNMFGVEIFQ